MAGARSQEACPLQVNRQSYPLRKDRNRRLRRSTAYIRDAVQAARLDAPSLTARNLLMDTTEWVTEVFLASGARLGWRRSPSAL